MSNQKKSLLAFGEVLFDMINGQAHMGGAPFNVAAHFAMHNNQSFLVSAIGTDQYGKNVLAKAQEYGVSTKYLKPLANKMTGIVEVSVNNDGQPSYEIIENVAWDFISLDIADHQSIQSTRWDCFYFGMLAQRNDISRKTLENLLESNQFETVFLDVNLRKNYYSKELLKYSFLKCNILKLNDEEVVVISQLLFGKILSPELFAEKASIEFDIKVVIITLGADGAAYFSNGVYAKVPGVKVKVSDTVGAGDSFAAAFLNSYLKGSELETALTAGCRLGAYVASKEGAIPAYEINYNEI